MDMWAILIEIVSVAIPHSFLYVHMIKCMHLFTCEKQVKPQLLFARKLIFSVQHEEQITNKQCTVINIYWLSTLVS